MKKILFILVVLLAFASCEKYDYEHSVQYLVTKSVNGFEVNYLNEDGNVIKENIFANSEDDQWTYSFAGERGDVVYLSVKDTTASSFVNVRVLVDGKVYKQASRNDDPDVYVTVSGTIPY